VAGCADGSALASQDSVSDSQGAVSDSCSPHQPPAILIAGIVHQSSASIRHPSQGQLQHVPLHGHLVGCLTALSDFWADLPHCYQSVSEYRRGQRLTHSLKKLGRPVGLLPALPRSPAPVRVCPHNHCSCFGQMYRRRDLVLVPSGSIQGVTFKRFGQEQGAMPISTLPELAAPSC
jgi:hypothetical protein